MNTARTIIFYFFLLVYVVTCPLLILYSFGYMIHPATKEVAHTGLVHFSSSPPGAEVYLERSRYVKRTPTAIDELLPGRYRVRVRLKGYKDWNHTVEIEAGKAVAFDSIILVPKVWQSEQLTSDRYSTITPMAGTNIFLLAEGTDLGTYSIYDWKKEKARPLVSPKSPFYDFPVNVISAEEGSEIFVVYGGSIWNKKYLRVVPRAEASDIADITRFFPERPNAIEWVPKENEDVFTLAGGSLNLVDMRSMTLLPGYVENVKGFGLTKGWIYVLDENNSIIKYSFDKKTKTDIFKDEALGKKLFRGSDIYKIVSLDSSTFVFVGKKGELIMNRQPYNVADRGVMGISFLDKKQQLLYWTRDSINIIGLLEDKTAEPLFRGIIRSRAVYNSGRDVRQCFWANDGSHIIFLDRDNLYLMELEPDGKNHVERICQIRKGSEIFYPDDTGYIYYLEPEGSLKKIKVIPE